MGRFHAFIGAILLAAFIPFAVSGQLELTQSRLFSLDLGGTGDGFAGDVQIPFRLGGPGQVYAKLLPTPGNSVHDGTRGNGTTTSDHTAGVDGWWVTFELRKNGTRIVRDLNEQPVVEPLGTFADGTPTKAVLLSAGADYALGLSVHAPQGAFDVWEIQRVYAVLGFREYPGNAENETGSGARMDAAHALTVEARGAPREARPPEVRDDAAGDGRPTTFEEFVLLVLVPLAVLGWLITLIPLAVNAYLHRRPR